MQKAVIIVAFLGSFLAFSSAAVAQSSETSLAITPAIIDVPIEAGSSVRKTIQATNNSQQAVPISIEAQPANIDGTALNQRGEDRFDVSGWVGFSQDVIVFDAGETKSIEFVVTAPFTALAGGYYAQLSLRALQLEQSESIDSVLPEIAVPLLITVPGEIIEDMQVRDVKVPSTATPGDTIKTTFDVENTGTVHNLISGRLVVAKDDQEIATYPIRPSVILPDTSKQVSVEWRTPDHGIYKVFIDFSYGSQRRNTAYNNTTIVITPPLHNLFGVAVLSWSGLYLYPKRRNISAAVRAVLTAKPD